MLNKKNIILLILIFLILSFIISFFLFQKSDSLDFCGDSSSFDSCSEMKPYYCSFGELIPRADLCGCEENFTIDGNSCSSEYFNDSSVSSFYFLWEGNLEKFELVLYESVMNYLLELPQGIFLLENETFERINFKNYRINNSLQRESLKQLVANIQNFEENKDSQAKIAIGLVQNIPYDEPKKISLFGGRLNSRISRYPYQVLYEDAGWCEGKSDLLVFLLRELGFSTAFFYFPENNHEAVGIKCPLEYSFRRTGYCFVETTFPSMISYSDGPYESFFQLSENFELIEFSEGISLSSELEDYKDAKTFSRINSKLINKGAISNYDKLIYEKIKEKYGIGGFI